MVVILYGKKAREYRRLAALIRAAADKAEGIAKHALAQAAQLKLLTNPTPTTKEKP
jgi:hypothetical protein